MANILGAVVQIDDVNYDVHAKVAENAEKLGGTPAGDYAKKTDLVDTNTTYDLASPASKTNGNVTIDLTAGGSGSGTDQVKIQGTGATTVTTNASGVIIINSTDTKTDTNTTYDLAAPINQTNGNVTIQLTASGSGSGTDSVKIQGSGATTVTTDDKGIITINSTGGGASTANNGTLTIKKNGANIATFTANSASDVVADISVPTITDNLTSTSTTAALSANQGRLLNEAISGFKKIIVSTEEPTDEAIGDIWFKY